MKKTYDIIIGGAGIVGSTMALALAEQGLSVALIDENVKKTDRNSKFNGRAYALSSTTVKMLAVLNVWNELSKTAQPILDMRISDGLAGRGAAPFHIHFDHREMESGPIAYMVEDRFFKRILSKEISVNKKISKFFGSKIVNQIVNSSSIEVQLENKSSLFGNLLIGSDGRRSSIGERAGIKRNIFDYRQTSVVCAVYHEQQHFGEAHQIFMPSGPLAILPLKNQISSIVWTETTEKANKLKMLNSNSFLKELALGFGNSRGQLSLRGARYFFPLSLSISKKLFSQRVALIGDAAHAVHPIAGQGLNLGMRDIASLTEVITIARRCGEDYGKSDVLGRYSTWREFDRVTLYSFTHATNEIFSTDNVVLRALRGIGMSAVNNVPAIRKELVKIASGQGDDIPLLMTGRRI